MRQDWRRAKAAAGTTAAGNAGRTTGASGRSTSRSISAAAAGENWKKSPAPLPNKSSFAKILNVFAGVAELADAQD